MKELIIIPAYNEYENIIKLINCNLINDSNNFITKQNIENYIFSDLKYIKRDMKIGNF